MKKLMLLFTILIALAVNASAQWINTTESTAFNFIAPEGASETTNEVLFPVSDVTTYDADNDTITLSIDQMVTFYSSTDTLQADTYFFTSVDDQVTAGALLFVSAKSGTTARAFIPDTGFTGTSTAGAIGKTKWLMFAYNGSSFIHVGTNQID